MTRWLHDPMLSGWLARATNQSDALRKLHSLQTRRCTLTCANAQSSMHMRSCGRPQRLSRKQGLLRKLPSDLFSLNAQTISFRRLCRQLHPIEAKWVQTMCPNPRPFRYLMISPTPDNSHACRSRLRWFRAPRMDTSACRWPQT